MIILYYSNGLHFIVLFYSSVTGYWSNAVSNAVYFERLDSLHWVLVYSTTTYLNIK